MVRRALVLVLLLCAGCGGARQGGDGGQPVAVQRQLAQAVGQVRMAGVGDDLVTLTRERLGQDDDGDIMGRTGRGGVTVLTYRGLQDGKAVLERRDVVFYEPEGAPRSFLDGGRSLLTFDPAGLPQTMHLDGVYVRMIEADRFILRYLLSRNPL
ncbi:MAG: hypothetical protein RIB84_03980 [Sneathiellaceae bacterium]